MKWFKHLAGSLKDSIIFEAIEKFGSDGYLVFFGTLELMADEFDIYNPEKVTISLKKMTSFFQLSRQKTVRILSFFDEKAKINQKKNKSFFAEVNKTHVTIICKRFAELADIHTHNELAKTNKSLISNLEVTYSPSREILDIKKEDNTDIKKNIKTKQTPKVKHQRNIIPPEKEWVEKYCLERKNGIDAQAFIDHYTNTKWKIGKPPGYPMTDWEASVRTWERNQKDKPQRIDTDFDYINKAFEGKA